jgi:hypothetical protein
MTLGALLLAVWSPEAGHDKVMLTGAGWQDRGAALADCPFASCVVGCPLVPMVPTGVVGAVAGVAVLAAVATDCTGGGVNDTVLLRAPDRLLEFTLNAGFALKMLPLFALRVPERSTLLAGFAWKSTPATVLPKLIAVDVLPDLVRPALVVDWFAVAGCLPKDIGEFCAIAVIDITVMKHAVRIARIVFHMV